MKKNIIWIFLICSLLFSSLFVWTYIYLLLNEQKVESTEKSKLEVEKEIEIEAPVMKDEETKQEEGIMKQQQVTIIDTPQISFDDESNNDGGDCCLEKPEEENTEETNHLLELAKSVDALILFTGEEKTLRLPSHELGQNYYWKPGKSKPQFHFIINDEDIHFSGDIAVLDATVPHHAQDYEQTWNATVNDNNVQMNPTGDIQSWFELQKGEESGGNRPLVIQPFLYVSPSTPAGFYYVTSEIELKGAISENVVGRIQGYNGYVYIQ
ncbi:hypothetical protein [Rossellomorea vietnamensis]|uniref:hypothetical protein n=1 Tax=Rossellomorea vietnamensis TaxID=218284 RepID=UPI003D2A01A2